MSLLHGLERAYSHLAYTALAGWMLEEDAARLRACYFGARSWALSTQPDPLTVYLGARSGLEAMTTLCRASAARVLVVEPDRARRATLRSVLGPRATLLAHIADLVPAVAGRPIAFLRVDGAVFGLADAEAALGHVRCAHLCGTFRGADTDPLAVYRASRDHLAASFFWRELETGLAFGSDRGPVEIEVSVVVPAYKVSAELDLCLETLARQTLRKLEVIVVVDGSPDNTGAIADSWASRFPHRISALHKPNGGCASARMAGLRAARGEFVGFVDGDDWVDPRMFEELYRTAALHCAEIAQCGYVEAFADGSHLDIPGAVGGDGWTGASGLVREPRDLLTLRPTIWRRIYRRTFVKSNEIAFPEHICRFDDLPFQFEALARARRVAVIPDHYYYYRRERPGQDVGARDKRLYVHFQIFDWLRERVMGWADMPVEAQLARVELATHAWALERIDRPFRAAYLTQARQQFLAGRVHLTPLHLLRIAFQAGPAALLFVVSALSSQALQRWGSWRQAGFLGPKSKAL